MHHLNRRTTGSAIAAAGLFLALQPAVAERVERDGLVEDGVAPAPAVLGAAWARYSRARATRLLDWLADGSLLVAPRVDGAVQAQRLVAPLATPEQFTFLAQDVSGAAAHPFDPKILAMRVLGADGHAQIYSQRVGDAGALALTDAGAHDDTPLWAHDGRRLAFASDRRNGRDFDVYIIETGSAATPRLIIGGGGRWRALDWSLDDRSLLLRRDDDPNDARLFIADVASGSLKAIDAPASVRPARTRVPAARFTPDGHAVLYLREAGENGYLRLELASLDGSAPRDVTPPLDHDIELFDVSADGRYLAYAWEDAGFSRIAVIDQRSGTEIALPMGLPLGSINALRFDRGGTRLALETEAATTPPDIHVIDLAANSVTRWTRSEPAVLDAAPPTPAQRLRFRTWDLNGSRPRELGGYFYTPLRDGRHPVLVLLHDGPEDRFRPGFDVWVQFVVNELGIAVVAPNLRGSSGTGRAFASLDDGLLREDAIRDIGSLLVWIGAQPRLDASRVLVMGRGYGGYQALAALALYGDRLRAAVAIDPLADLLAAAAATPSATTEFGSSANEQQRAFLQRISPLGFAGSILRPVLLAHFDGTATSGLSGTEQILWRMRANRRDAAYVAVDPARCGTGCGQARAAAWAAIGAYIKEALAPESPGTPP
jgi:dipeptidyl aminopeptidase/acylaminoacyl peptidase